MSIPGSSFTVRSIVTIYSVRAGLVCSLFTRQVGNYQGYLLDQALTSSSMIAGNRG
jgi:hypothetical protein